MSTSTALVPVEPRTLTPDVWHMIGEIAPVMHAARMFGVASKEQAAAIMLKGYELGFGLTASFEFVQMVMGKPELKPRGALAILQDHPAVKTLEIRRLTDQHGVYVGHECYIKRTNGFEYTAKFSLQDAQRAGLIKPGGGWESYPENMCMWRAVGFAADVAAPDLCAGATMLLKAPERYGVALTAEGDVVEGEVVPASNLAALVEKYGAEKVMSANSGRIPETEVEITTAAKVLEGV
jgi:hypothetical protein